MKASDGESVTIVKAASGVETDWDLDRPRESQGVIEAWNEAGDLSVPQRARPSPWPRAKTQVEGS